MLHLSPFEYRAVRFLPTSTEEYKKGYLSGYEESGYLWNRKDGIPERISVIREEACVLAIEIASLFEWIMRLSEGFN